MPVSFYFCLPQIKQFSFWTFFGIWLTRKQFGLFFLAVWRWNYGWSQKQGLFSFWVGVFELYTLWLWLHFSMGLVLESFVNSGLGQRTRWSGHCYLAIDSIYAPWYYRMVLFWGSHYKEASYGGSEIRLTAVVFVMPLAYSVPVLFLAYKQQQQITEN